MDLVHPEEMEPQTASDDVDNGIHRAHLVKVHLLDVHPVNMRFSFTETLEDR